MAEVNPPAWERDGCYTAQKDRQVIAGIICQEGVKSPSSGSLLVTPGVGMSVSVAAGSAYIQGDNIANQGMYFVLNDASDTIAIAASDPTDPRIDLIVARVYDSEYAGALDEWRLERVAGTPSPAPVPPALPLNSIPLAQVNVAAAATTVTVTDVRDSYDLCADAVPIVKSNPHIRRTKPSAQLIANNTSVVVTFPDEVDNFPASHPISYAAGVFTVSKSGRYAVGAGWYWASSPTGQRQMRLLRNSDILAVDTIAGVGQSFISASLETTIHLNAGDTISFVALQTSGGNLNIEGATTRNWATVTFLND